MKTLLLVLLCVAFPSLAAVSQDYPEKGRFVQYDVEGTNAYILKDTKTGCEYLYAAGPTAFTLVEGTCTNLPEARK